MVALSGVSPFEQAYMSRGVEQWLLDLAGDPDFALALLRKITDLMKASVIRLLEEAGDTIDVLVTGDDLGSQTATLISPRMYRRMIKPFHAEIYQEIKKRTKAKIFYHSDGNIYPLLGDLVEIGIDLLNPVQVNAGDMGDTARLKREFGDRLSFCGAIDTGGCCRTAPPQTCAPRCAGGSGIWGRAAVTSWRRCTASSPTCRWRTSSRCSTKRRSPGGIR